MHTKSSGKSDVGLTAILEGLAEADVEYVLVGGLAAVIQGAPITTMDVDILHDQSPENIARLLRYLRSIGAIYRRPDDKVIEPEKEDFAGMGHRLFTTRLGPLDALTYIEEGKTYEDLRDHVLELVVRGHKIPVLDLKKIVELKRGSQDPRDKLRLPVLEEALRQLGE